MRPQNTLVSLGDHVPCPGDFMHRASTQAAAASGMLCEEVMFLFKPLNHFIFGKAMQRGLSVHWSVRTQKVGCRKHLLFSERCRTQWVCGWHPQVHQHNTGSLPSIQGLLSSMFRHRFIPTESLGWIRGGTKWKTKWQRPRLPSFSFTGCQPHAPPPFNTCTTYMHTHTDALLT